MEILFSAWTTAVWWAAVIFFIGLILGVISFVLAFVVFLISELLDDWADKHSRKKDS